jgi:hypothetical protein
MFDVILDWTVVVLPTLLGILGLLFSLKAPRETTHRKWRFALLAGGLAISALTYFQQSRSRNSHSAELRGQEEAIGNLQKMIEEAEIKRETDSAFLRSKLDTKELAALSSAIHNYAQQERAKQPLSRMELRERALTIVHRMREFQLRYDFEEGEITRRFLQGLDEAARIEATETRQATAKLQSGEKLTPAEQNVLLQKKIDAGQIRIEKIREVGDNAEKVERQLAERYTAEFRSSLLGEASYVRDEILRTLPSQRQPTQSQTIPILAFQGVLVNSRSVGLAADYLEGLANRLSR